VPRTNACTLADVAVIRTVWSTVIRRIPIARA